MPATFMSGNDRAMDSISHRPRRLGGPLAAIAAVAVLIVILIVTGLHSTPSSTTSHSRSHSHSPPASQTGTQPRPPARHHSTTATSVPHHPTVTNTTVAPVVSAPTSTSAQGASYTVGSANYALALSATSGACWLQVTDTSTGAVLFSGTLSGGESHTVTASGPVTVVVGAPSAFAATVDGTPVTVPPGGQAPFTLTFQTPQGSGSGSGSG
jgi:cytoskeletal protein RodZ